MRQISAFKDMVFSGMTQEEKDIFRGEKNKKVLLPLSQKNKQNEALYFKSKLKPTVGFEEIWLFLHNNFNTFSYAPRTIS